MSVMGYFELDEDRARVIAAEVGQAVATWREEAARMGLRQAEIDRMASAFEHEDLREALSLAGSSGELVGRNVANSFRQS